jgi:hypothetical protein
VSRGNVLITGGGGQLASDLEEQLPARGVEARVLARDELDITDEAAVERAFADARAALGEARELFREADNLMGMLSVVLGSCYLARWEERYEDALRLAGAAEALRQRVGGRAPLDFLAGFLGDPETEARAQLPPDLARRAWAEGRTSGTELLLGGAGLDAPLG